MRVSGFTRLTNLTKQLNISLVTDPLGKLREEEVS